MAETIIKTKFDLTPVGNFYDLFTRIPSLAEVADEFDERNGFGEFGVLVKTPTQRGLIVSWKETHNEFNALIYANGVASSPSFDELNDDREPRAFMRYHLEGKIDDETVHLCASIYGNKVLREDDTKYWFLTNSKRSD